MKKIIFFVFINIISSCNFNNSNNEFVGKYAIEINGIILDSITIDASNTSGMGTFFMEDSLICFFDLNYNTLYKYKLNGEFLTRTMGSGRGPGEINIKGIKLFSSFDSKIYYLIGDNTVTSINKSNGATKFLGTIDMGWNTELKRNNNPDPLNPGCYEMNPKNICSFQPAFIDNENFVFQIAAGHPKFNGYDPNCNADKCFEEGRNLGIININKLKMEKVIIKYPEIYQKYKYIPNFDHSAFQINGDTIMISFAADSLIYFYKLPEKELFKIGFSGKNMNTNYRQIKSVDENRGLFRKEALDCGYYFDLDYIKETNLICRVYAKGKPINKYGLQIYKNYNLIADVNVPQFFQLLGYYKGKYYAVRSWPDLVNQKFVFYSFNI